MNQDGDTIWSALTRTGQCSGAVRDGMLKSGNIADRRDLFLPAKPNRIREIPGKEIVWVQ